jgi:hypothetical protein
VSSRTCEAEAVTSHRFAWHAFIAAGIVAIAPAVWGLAELAPDSVGADAQPDYLVRPLGLSTAARTTITIGAASLAIAAALTFVRARRRQDVGSEWVGVLVPLVAVSGAAGLVYSAVTEPVIGANIGGGLAVMAGIPFAVAMVTLAAWRAVRARRSTAG